MSRAFFETAKETAEYLIKTLDRRKAIGIGGSKTVEDTGLYDKLTNAGFTVHLHWTADEATSLEREIKELARHDPVYISSVNALTETGKIVNVDGAANRISAMIFGPEEVYFFVGRNKICADLEAAHERIFNYVSPRLAKMLSYRTPCVKTGKCGDYSSHDRCCRVETILHKPPRRIRMHVLLIDEDLGI